MTAISSCRRSISGFDRSLSVRWMSRWSLVSCLAQRMPRRVSRSTLRLIRLLDTPSRTHSCAAVVICGLLESRMRMEISLGERFSSGGLRTAYAYNALQMFVPPLLLLLSTAALVGNSYNPFLYFQF